MFAGEKTRGRRQSVVRINRQITFVFNIGFGLSGSRYFDTAGNARSHSPSPENRNRRRTLGEATDARAGTDDDHALMLWLFDVKRMGFSNNVRGYKLCEGRRAATIMHRRQLTFIDTTYNVQYRVRHYIIINIVVTVSRLRDNNRVFRSNGILERPRGKTQKRSGGKFTL